MLVNNRTQILLSAFISNPTSSVIVQGSRGSNSAEIITHICDTLLTHKNNIIEVYPEKHTIGVGQVRELKRTLTTKISGAKIGRIGIIYNADTMTNEAQNALLKLIEEPVQNTLVVLQSHGTNELLTTIRSRCQTISVLPISQAQAEEYGKGKASESDVQKAFLLSGGEAQLFKDIIDGTNMTVLRMVDVAKEYLKMNSYERLTNAKKFATSEDLPKLLEGLAIVSSAGLHGAKGAGVSRWSRILKTCLQCQSSLKSNSPTKLVYLKLSTNI